MKGLLLVLVFAFIVGACSNAKRNSGSVSKHQVQTQVNDANEKQLNVLLKLPKDVLVSEVLDEFRGINLTLVSEVSSELNIHLFSYKTSDMSPEDVLLTLKESEKVVEAQLDKKVDLRD